jgi:hypothetical protein
MMDFDAKPDLPPPPGKGGILSMGSACDAGNGLSVGRLLSKESVSNRQDRINAFIVPSAQ